MSERWESTFKILREKSTMAGLVGLAVVIAGAIGIEVSPEQELALTELVLAIISIVAIATRPKEPPRYGHPETWHDRREDHVGVNRSVSSSTSGPVRSYEGSPEQEAKDKTDGNGYKSDGADEACRKDG